jgi:putative acetyltransferase
VSGILRTGAQKLRHKRGFALVTVLAMDVRIRPERPDDFQLIDKVVADAFGSAAEAKLVRDVRASELYWPELALVATLSDTVVGHVMISGAELRSVDGATTIAMLSPLAVSPAHQRQGIGDALVRAVCAVADDRGEPMVILQGSPAYYGRFGFVPSADHDIAIDLPDWAPPEAAQVLRLAAWTGRHTGQLILPPAFEDLD